MNNKTGTVALAAAMATIGLSCSDGLTPTHFAEQWAAHSIDGQLVPHRYLGTIVDMLVLADTIVFGTQRRFEQRSVWENDQPGYGGYDIVRSPPRGIL